MMKLLLVATGVDIPVDMSRLLNLFLRKPPGKHWKIEDIVM